MNKIQLNDLLKNNQLNSKCITDTAVIYSLPNNKIFKMFHTKYLEIFNIVGINLEEKLSTADTTTLPKEIIKPEVLVYDGTEVIGYIMAKAKGINYNTRDINLTMFERSNLLQYADLHFKLEKIIRSTPDIVYPDICTCENIYISGPDIQLIDYDGFQIGKHKTLDISSSLGNQIQYFNTPKYITKDLLFTKELDKKSLIILYFLSTFNIDLNRVGTIINPLTNQPFTLEEVLSCIGLEDYDIMNKIWKIFQNNKENDWLGEDVYRLAYEYDLQLVSGPLADGSYLKKLIKK